MRCSVSSVLFIVAASLCSSAEQPGLNKDELSGVQRALSLWNLDISDLGLNKPSKADPYRLEIVDQTLGAPIDGLATLMSWQEAARKAGDYSLPLVRHAWSQVLPLPESKTTWQIAISPELQKLPPDLIEPVKIATNGIYVSNERIKKAFVALSPAEKADLLKSLPSFVDVPDIKIPEAASGKKLSFDETLKLIDKVDLNEIRSASIAATRSIEQAAALLKAVNTSIPKPIYLNVNGIKVIIGSTGDDRHICKPNELIIDLKGNDSYNGQVGAGIMGTGALIDLSGADRFNLSDISAGAGFAGVGIVVDNGGNERFYGKNICLGAGLVGSGVFVKIGGHDEYRSTAFSEGAGEFGVGLLVDTKGNDRYDAGANSQGYASLKGIGWLAERGGNDVYTIGGLNSGAPLDPQSWECFGQGAGYGHRLDTGGEGGGAGILSDLSGDDLYKGGMYCQGASYWYTVGALMDDSGNDTYIADYYSQGAAMHATSAYLLDLKGDDIYTVRHGAMQAIGHDDGFAMILDREGDDIYAGRDSRPAQASANGNAIFIDTKGNDRYMGPVGVGKASGGSGSIAVFADLAGQDIYAAGLKDGEVALSGVWGVAMDLADPVGTIPAGTPIPHQRPKPGTATMPSDSEMETIFTKASQWGVGSAQKEVDDNVDRLIAIGVPAVEWMLKHKLASTYRLTLRTFQAVLSGVGAEGQALLAPYVKSSNENEAYYALYLSGSYKVAGAEPFLKDALLNSRLQGVAIAAAGALKVKALIPDLTGFAMGKDPNRSLQAVQALDAIGSEESAHTYVALCTSPELPIRKAAIRALAKMPERALETVKTLLTREGRVLRVGIELLGEIGTPASEALLIEQLKSTKTEVRVETIRAMALKNPAKFGPSIEPLAKDPNEDVRSMARWALSRK